MMSIMRECLWQNMHFWEAAEILHISGFLMLLLFKNSSDMYLKMVFYTLNRV